MADQESKITVTRPGADLAVYFRESKGAWVVFVNGHTRPGSDFRAFMRLLDENGWASMTLDNRGAGATKYTGAFQAQDMVDDILAGMHALKINNAHMLGISMGGVLVQHLAAQEPSYVKSLALVSTTCRDQFLKSDDSPWGDELQSIREKMRPYFSERFYQGNKLLIDAMCKQILKNTANGSFAQGAADQKRAINSYDTTNLLGSIHCPVKIFHGAEDKIISVKVVDEFLQFLPKAEKAIYQGVGHLLLAECPKQLYQDYLNFLGNIGN